MFSYISSFFGYGPENSGKNDTINDNVPLRVVIDYYLPIIKNMDDLGKLDNDEIDKIIGGIRKFMENNDYLTHENIPTSLSKLYPSVSKNDVKTFNSLYASVLKRIYHLVRTKEKSLCGFYIESVYEKDGIEIIGYKLVF